MVSFAGGSRKTLFFASDVAAKELIQNKVDLANGISAVAALGVGNTLVRDFDKAIEEIDGQNLVRSNPIDRLLFGTFIVHYVPAFKKFELITINVYRPGAPNRTAIERSYATLAIPSGAATSVLAFAKANPKSFLAVALQQQSPSPTWSHKKSLQVATQMISIAHKNEPDKVGDSIDAILLRQNGTAAWLCRSVSAK